MEETLYFALLDENNVVVNIIAPKKYNKDLETDEMVLYDPSGIISVFSGAVSTQQYSKDDDSITKNPGAIGYTYDSTLNAFIPPKPDETYILDTEDFNWYPDPEIEYELHGDGIMYKSIPKVGWTIVQKVEEVTEE
jgi:hypothetical protein